MSKEIFGIVVLLIVSVVLIARAGYLIGNGDKEATSSLLIVGGIIGIAAICGIGADAVKQVQAKKFKVEPGETIELDQILIKGEDTTRWFNVIKDE